MTQCACGSLQKVWVVVLLHRIIVADCVVSSGGPAGLELHENVLSPEEQANMIATIEQWVVQVSLLALIDTAPGACTQPACSCCHSFWSLHICSMSHCYKLILRNTYSSQHAAATAAETG